MNAFAGSAFTGHGRLQLCFDSGKYASRVEQDYLDGKAAGVTGTPVFLITYTVDGEEKQRFIAGAYPFSEFQT